MLSNDRKHILMMNPVHVSLYVKKFEKDSEGKKSSNHDYLDAALNVSFMGSDPRRGNLNVWDGIPIEMNRTFDSKAARFMANLWLRARMMFVKKPSVSPSEFFDNVKGSLFELRNIEIADEKELKKQLEKLEITKQRYERDHLNLAHQVAKAEKVIKEGGFNKFITEKELIKFILKSKKGLVLQELQYFKYEIPDDVIVEIGKAEDLRVFDNYYVLYYDPDAKVNLFWRKEVEDPIVFGVLMGSDKLYFIADWVTEFCDLTYSKLLKEIGKV